MNVRVARTARNPPCSASTISPLASGRRRSSSTERFEAWISLVTCRTCGSLAFRSAPGKERLASEKTGSGSSKIFSVVEQDPVKLRSEAAASTGANQSTSRTDVLQGRDGRPTEPRCACEIAAVAPRSGPFQGLRAQVERSEPERLGLCQT